MHSLRSLPPFFVAFGMALLLLSAARADDLASKQAFSDPAKPGTLKIRVWHGNVTVHGADVPDVTVQTDSKAAPAPRKDGLRVLTASSAYVLTEKDNVMTLEYGLDGGGVPSVNFTLTVPRATAVVVASSVGGNLTCTDLTGDIDVRSLDGRVDLENIMGGALVETMNGRIQASVKELHEGKPLSFTSMNGKIVIVVPPAAKAAIRFRTHNGAILTDFDEKELTTKTEVVHRAAPAAAATAAGAPPAADSDDEWKEDLRESLREAADQARMAAREAAYAVHESLATLTNTANRPPRPLPPLPPMTGGKIISGALNGGGVEIQAATMNGDITLRKVSSNKQPADK